MRLHMNTYLVTRTNKIILRKEEKKMLAVTTHIPSTSDLFFVCLTVFIFNFYIHTKKQQDIGVSVFRFKSKQAMCIAGVRFMSSLSIFQYFLSYHTHNDQSLVKIFFCIVTFSRDNKEDVVV